MWSSVEAQTKVHTELYPLPVPLDSERFSRTSGPISYLLREHITGFARRIISGNF